MIHLLFALWSCNPAGAPAEAGGCTYDADCGASEACLNGACAAVDCLRTDDCPLGQLCGGDHQCAAGCAVDSDCASGARCDAGACVPQACDSTLADCAVGQVCEYGEFATCEVPAGEWCTPCDRDAPTACGAAAMCFRWEWEDPTEAYCLPTCDPAALNPCAVGFICAEMEEDAFYCLANCHDLLEYGALGP